MIGTLGGNDTISYYEMAEPTTRDGLIDTLGGNGSSGSDGADTLLASYFGGNGSSESDGADTLLAGYSADNGSSDGKKLKQLRPLGQQLFSSQEESGETIPVASDITLTSEPPVVGKTITVTHNRDSGGRSLRSAVADSTKVTLKNLIIANGTGGSQEEPTESGGNDLTGEDYSEASPYDTIPTGNGNDGFRSTLGIINTGNGHDSLIGGDSELRPISEILLPLPPTPSFRWNGFPGLSAIERSQEAVSEFSGISSVEATLLLPSLQKVREAARRLSGFITGDHGNDSLF
ncbi:hypothetical protein QUB37_21670 [Microcoleus sp. AT3-A2]|uniref:hypothetical protein n=1 Tax=Microcoleus sp. AT3-A2 TaxID=2818610 RepID=UPI002FD04F1D